MFNLTKKSLSGAEFAQRKSSDRTFLKTMTAKWSFHQWWPLQSYAERFFGITSARTWCERPIFSTGWRSMPYVVCYNRFFASNVSWTSHKFGEIWRYHLATEIARFDTARFFFVGLPQKQGLYQSSTVSVPKSTYRKKLPTFLSKHCATLWKVSKIELQLASTLKMVICQM